MTYHREQELLAMGDASTRKDEERCDRRVTTSPTKASLCDCGACIPQSESNPASLSVTSVNADAQIAPRNDVVTSLDAVTGGIKTTCPSELESEAFEKWANTEEGKNATDHYNTGNLEILETHYSHSQRPAMAQAIKQFLESDAKRTQGEWFLTKYTNYSGYSVHPIEGGFGCIAERWEEGQKDTARIQAIMANGDFIAAASRIAPDIRQLLAAFEQVCEALSRLGTIHEATLMDYEGMNAAGDSEDLRDVENALAAAAPYRKLMGGV